MIWKNKNLKTMAMAGIFALGVIQKIHGANEDSGALRTREFLIMGYEGLHFELQTGEGPYLQTLTDLLKTDPQARAHTIENIRLLSRTYPNIMDFADHVVLLQSTGAVDAVSVARPLLPVGVHVYSGDQLENALNHLTRGMKVTVFLKTGGRTTAQFEEYVLRRLWLLGPTRQSFKLDDILGIEAPRL